MGQFRVSIEVSGMEGGERVSLDALVDTGASYLAVPASLLRSLGVQPHRTLQFTLADGRVIERGMGRVWLRIGDREEVTVVAFNDEETLPLLGAVALEDLSLGVDPLARRLIPVGGWMM